MESFVIIATARYGCKGEILKEVMYEERAINEAMRIFRVAGMQKVIVVNEHMTIIFKDTRICKCTNRQSEMFLEGQPRYIDRCMDCHIVLDHGAWRNKYAEESAEVDAGLEERTTVGTVPCVETKKEHPGQEQPAEQNEGSIA